jgi:putative transposase
MEIRQAKDSRYVKNAGAVFNLSYHIVFCPKYRRKVLVGDVESRLKHILYATAQQYGVLIERMEVMPDHVHLFGTSDPTGCVAEIVKRWKGVSGRLLRQEFRHWVAKMPTLRSPLVLRWHRGSGFGIDG